jgi:superkiller protein 3
MSHLLEILGRGLIGQISGAFGAALGPVPDAPTEDLRQAIYADPDDLDAQVRLAVRYLHCDDAVAARNGFLDVLRRDSDHNAARIGLACSYDELGRTEAALEELGIVQKADPTNPATLFCLGYCHERLGAHDQAVVYYQDSITVCPTLRNAHERLAAIFLQQNDTDLAIHHYAELCRLDPDQPELHLMLASLLLKAGDHQAAVERFEHALSLEPENWAAHGDLVSTYEQAGLYREAIEHLHEMIEKNPEVADSHSRLGDLYARVGNDAAATAQYERAVQMCPDYLEANVKLGTQHLRAGRYEEASRWFSFALEINDRVLGAYVGIGVAQHAEGRVSEALASFEMAQNVEPNSTLLFSEIARMQLKAAAGEQADKFLPLAVGIEDATDGAPGIAKDLLSRQIERLAVAVEQNPNHADLHYRLGLLYRNRGQIEDAISCFRQAVTINPSYMKALIKLGLALKEAGETDESISVLKRAADLHPDYMDLHYQLGLLFAQKHQFEIAVEQLDRAVEPNPRNVSFQANLALALQNMGLVDRANATWQIVQDLSPNSPYLPQARSSTPARDPDAMEGNHGQGHTAG